MGMGAGNGCEPHIPPSHNSYLPATTKVYGLRTREYVKNGKDADAPTTIEKKKPKPKKTRLVIFPSSVLRRVGGEGGVDLGYKNQNYCIFFLSSFFSLAAL